MKPETTFRVLVLVCVALLGYIVWMNTKEIVDLELELDKLRGAVGGSVAANPVPPAAAKDAIVDQTFEETLGG